MTKEPIEWFKLKMKDDHLNSLPSVRKWLNEVERIIKDKMLEELKA